MSQICTSLLASVAKFREARAAAATEVVTEAGAKETSQLMSCSAVCIVNLKLLEKAGLVAN